MELFLVVCQSSAPDRCQTVYLRDEGVGSMMQCLFNGAKQAARWVEDHPGNVVKRWSCGQPRA